MTFIALLTKELRLRLRRERAIWVIIIYLLVLSLIGFFYLNQAGSLGAYDSYALGQLAPGLYQLLAVVQLVLIVFITPAFTSTTINGEKERQTFDMLLCSRISSFSLMAAKLVAGLANALLLIAASVPVFSLVFFFGGVSPGEILATLLVFVVTTVFIGTFGLFCSTLFKRAPASTSVSYIFAIAWIVVPWIIVYGSYVGLFGSPIYANQNGPAHVKSWLAWNPIAGLFSALPAGEPAGSYTFKGIAFPHWAVYTVLSLVMTLFLFLFSVLLVKPNLPGRLRLRRRKLPQPVGS